MIFNKPKRFYSVFKNRYKILFFGSDDVSIVSFRKVNELRKQNEVKSLALVTANKSKKLSLIEKYAIEENVLRLTWQDLNIEHSEFDLGVVVSFGYLIPKMVIEKFPLGMINVHTSLLPRWRGAAPVIHTLLNGDKETGVTLMKIEPEKFDIGDIISQKKISVHPDTVLPELTEQLAVLGANQIEFCIRGLPESLLKCKKQPTQGVTYAKKITSSISIVHWEEMTSDQVYNLYRAIYGIYPLRTKFKGKDVKLFNAYLVHDDVNTDPKLKAGSVNYCKERNSLKVLCKDQKFIHFKTLRVVGKKEICALDFYNGYMKSSKKDSCFTSDNVVKLLK